MRRVRRAIFLLLRAIWRATGKPIYEMVLGVHLRGAISRLESALGELRSQRAAIDALSAQLRAQTELIHQLNRQVATALPTAVEITAISRRLAALEDLVSELSSAATQALPDGVKADRGL